MFGSCVSSQNACLQVMSVKPSLRGREPKNCAITSSQQGACLFSAAALPPALGSRAYMRGGESNADGTLRLGFEDGRLWAVVGCWQHVAGQGGGFVSHAPRGGAAWLPAQAGPSIGWHPQRKLMPKSCFLVKFPCRPHPPGRPS